MTNKNNHGGKRAGSGRKHQDPRLLKIPVSYKLPRWLVEWLRSRDESAAVLIEDAICHKHNLKQPETRGVKK